MTNQPHDPSQPTDPSQHAAWQPPHMPAPPAPEPASKSWFARHKILTGLLAFVLLGIVISAVNGGGSSPTASIPVADAPAADAPSKKSAAAPAAPAAPAKPSQDDTPATPTIGQKVRDGQFEFTVTKVRKGVASVGDSAFGQKAQGQYVLVSVTVSNIGDTAQLLADSSQKVRDAKGREFSSDTTAAIYIKDNKVFFNEINPGNSVTGTLVYDMPKGTVPASIELHDSPFSGGVTVSLS